MRRAAKLVRHGHLWPLVIRPDRAAGEQQRGGGHNSDASHWIAPTAATSSLFAARRRRRSAMRITTTKHTGTAKIARTVAEFIPPNTAVPSAWREDAPAPEANT